MTETLETNTRAALARAHLAAALVEAGTAPALARHVAAGAKIESVTANGALLLVGDLRAVDEAASLAEMAQALVTGPAKPNASTPTGDDAASNETARAAGRAAGQAQKAASITSPLAFK